VNRFTGGTQIRHFVMAITSASEPTRPAKLRSVCPATSSSAPA
jgi:hypothetical protein